MNFEQFDNCMRHLGIYSGESYRHYQPAQHTRKGIDDRLERPIGQDNRFRLYDLEWKVLSKLGKEAEPGLTGAAKQPPPSTGRPNSLKKGQIAHAFQSALVGGSDCGTARSRALSFEQYCHAVERCIRACVYGPSAISTAMVSRKTKPISEPVVPAEEGGPGGVLKVRIKEDAQPPQLEVGGQTTSRHGTAVEPSNLEIMAAPRTQTAIPSAA